ncbi:MAG TPA: TlpA disulfide reductase family protein [Rubricoccaceae bacterium]|jgi:thiol-disulfide isomerase/thioredoxin
MTRLLLALPLVALAGCGAGSTPPAAPSDIVEVADASALVESVAGLGQEAVVLNFWATWCGPCRAEFPTFVRYDAEQAGQGVEVRFVSIDAATDLPAVRAFLDEHDVSEPSYLYTGTDDVTSALAMGVGGAIPVTMILDGQGIVRHVTVGAMGYDDLAEKVAAVRRGESPDAPKS